MDLVSILNPAVNSNVELCDVCGKSFNKRCTLLRHKRNVHALHSPCQYCKKGLKLNSRPYAYKTHLLRCSVFLNTYSHLDLEKRTEKAEDDSLILRQRRRKDSKEIVLTQMQENSPTEDKKMVFPPPVQQNHLIPTNSVFEKPNVYASVMKRIEKEHLRVGHTIISPQMKKPVRNLALKIPQSHLTSQILVSRPKTHNGVYIQ